jgi:hypothetical protein
MREGGGEEEEEEETNANPWPFDMSLGSKSRHPKGNSSHCAAHWQFRIVMNGEQDSGTSRQKLPVLRTLAQSWSESRSLMSMALGRSGVWLALAARGHGRPGDTQIPCTVGQTKLDGVFGVRCSQSLAMETRSAISLERRSASLSLAAFSSAATIRTVAAVTNGKCFLNVQEAHNRKRCSSIIILLL